LFFLLQKCGCYSESLSFFFFFLFFLTQVPSQFKILFPSPDPLLTFPLADGSSAKTELRQSSFLFSFFLHGLLPNESPSPRGHSFSNLLSFPANTSFFPNKVRLPRETFPMFFFPTRCFWGGLGCVFFLCGGFVFWCGFFRGGVFFFFFLVVCVVCARTPIFPG